MDLDALKRLVVQSSSDDWEVIVCWGGGGTSGPSYLDRFGEVADGGGVRWLEHAAHTHRATFRPNVAVGLAWGLSRPDDKRSFDWNAFPDDDCYPTLVDVLFSGALVARHVGLVIDGGRGVLPFPEVDYDEDQKSEWFDTAFANYLNDRDAVVAVTNRGVSERIVTLASHIEQPIGGCRSSIEGARASAATRSG